MEICNRENRLYDVPCGKASRLVETGEKLQREKVSTLQELIDALHEAFETDHVNIDYVQDLMISYKSNPTEWKKFAKFDRYRYTRNLVDEGNGRFNLMVLCWGEGHGSAIHDHANAHCVMKILQGKLCETRYAWPTESEMKNDMEELKEIERNTLDMNEICYINDSMGLHRVENPSAMNPAVSLHLYSPPFSSCSVFNKQTGQKSTCKVTFWSKYGERRNRVRVIHAMASLHVRRVRKLYKTILRLHRGLPVEIRPLGDDYVRDEFRRHKGCVESEAIVFLHEWTNYAVSLAEQLGLKGPHTGRPLGRYLKEEDLEKLRDEQVCQLYELMIAATRKPDGTQRKT